MLFPEPLNQSPLLRENAYVRLKAIFLARSLQVAIALGMRSGSLSILLLSYAAHGVAAGSSKLPDQA